MNKTAQRRHWYNNGDMECCLMECPDGWKPGRLPVSQATREKHKNNNGMHNLTAEQKEARSKKLREYHANMTTDQREMLSKNISKNRKGKGVGKEPWNKGLKGKQEAWNKGLHLSDDIRKKISETKQNKSDEEKQLIEQKRRASRIYGEAWNKGKILGPIPEDKKNEILRKEYITKNKNNSFNTSKPENSFYNSLLNIFSEDDIYRQYSDDRYPFACDFYIKSLDLFIELNLTWTHGGHAFNQNNDEDINLLNYWNIKAETSDFYKNAIYTWTDLDVRKINKALENNLNYIALYTKEELESCLMNLSKNI